MEESNLAELRNKCLNSAYTCPGNISKYIDDESARIEEFNKLRTCVMNYCQMELHEEAGKKAIHSFEKETDVGDWDSVQNQYKNKLAQYNKQHAKYDKHSFVTELERHIKTAERSHGGQDSEQDVAITETTDNYIDPISKRPIINPMRNTICNHVYDKEPIESIVRNKKNKGCPYFGCTNNQVMLAEHLELDEELLLTIRRTQHPSQLSQEL